MAVPLFLLAACSGGKEHGPVVVSVIGTTAQMREPIEYPLSPPGKLMLESTAQGLVSFDAQGQVIPALAERWIVEDDGRSYIFRLKRASWPDGDRIKATEIARLLDARIRANLRLDQHGDLDAIKEVRAMTGEVIEIDLSVPRPNLLQILAQPQLGISRRDGGTGPYRKRPHDHTAYYLTPVPDATAGPDHPPALPADRRIVRAERAAAAIVRFRRSLAGLVLGGRYQDLPLLSLADIDKKAVRMDPVQGLFGLAVIGRNPFVGDQSVREALSMAIERDRLPGLFSLGGWSVTNAILPPFQDQQGAVPRWNGLAPDQRFGYAAKVIAAWSAAHGPVPPVRIALPAGVGSRMLFGLIAGDFARIGVTARPVGMDAEAELKLIDEVAAYDSPFWYLSRIGCSNGLACGPDAAARLDDAGRTADPAQRARKIADAEQAAIGFGGYIPLAQPIRWSLVSRRLTGFMPSPRARHPLNQLFRAPS